MGCCDDDHDDDLAGKVYINVCFLVGEATLAFISFFTHSLSVSAAEEVRLWGYKASPSSEILVDKQPVMLAVIQACAPTSSPTPVQELQKRRLSSSLFSFSLENQRATIQQSYLICVCPLTREKSEALLLFDFSFPWNVKQETARLSLLTSPTSRYEQPVRKRELWKRDSESEKEREKTWFARFAFQPKIN